MIIHYSGGRIGNGNPTALSELGNCFDFSRRKGHGKRQDEDFVFSVGELSLLNLIIGDKVKATMPETITAPASVNANSRNNAPVNPP